MCALRPPTEDHQSDTSGETTTSDSGRGGSEEDIQLPPLPEHCEDTSRMVFTNVGSGLKDSRFVQSDNSDTRGRDAMAFETFNPRTLPGISGFKDRSPFAGRDTQTLHHPEKHRHNRKGNVPYDPQNCNSQHYQLSGREDQQQPHHHLQQQHSSPTSGQHPSPDRGEISKKVTFQTGLTTQNLKTWDLCQKLSLQPEAASRSQTGYHGNSRSQRLLFVNRPRSQDDDDNTTTSGSYTISPENDNEDILAVSFPAA